MIRRQYLNHASVYTIMKGYINENYNIAGGTVACAFDMFLRKNMNGR